MKTLNLTDLQKELQILKKQYEKGFLTTIEYCETYNQISKKINLVYHQLLTR